MSLKRPTEPSAYYLSLLRDFWKLHLICLLLFGATAFIQVSYFKPKQYRSDAVIMPRSRGGDNFSGKVGGIMASLGMSASSLAQDVQQLQALLKSNRLRELAQANLKTKLPDEDPMAIDRLGAIALTVNGSVFGLTTLARTPLMAQNFLLSYLDELQKFMSKSSTEQSLRTAGFIDARIEEVKSGLDKIEDAIVKTRVNPSQEFLQGRSAESQAAKLRREYQVQSAVLETLSQQKEIAQIEAKREEQMFIVVDPATLPLQPSGPRTKVEVGFGCLAGILFSLFLVWSLERLKRLQLIDFLK